MVRKDNSKTYTLLVILLVIIEISSLFLLNKSAINRPVILDEVVLKQPDKHEKTFAILLQSGNDYIPSETFPDSNDYIYDRVKSGCIDETGQRILINGENVITYDPVHQLAELSTPSTSYCYLYFNTRNTANMIKASPGVSNRLIEGLYRYQGTTADNYICFGTTDKTTCTGDTDKYMYRIIGIDSSGQMKLVKKEALNSKIAWASEDDDIEWPDSEIFDAINGSSFLEDTDYVPSGWEDRIIDANWHYGDIESDDVSEETTPSDVATMELGFPTVEAKIGLMYIHDYDYSLAGGNNCFNDGTPEDCATSWLYLWQSQNDSGAPDIDLEWIITRSGLFAANYYAWTLYSTGATALEFFTETHAVRPVFFLSSAETIVSGTGTLADPYLLANGSI